MQRNALIIGNTDGIGLAASKTLLERGWRVIGISRSPSPVDHPEYNHHVSDLKDDVYPGVLESLIKTEAPLDPENAPEIRSLTGFWNPWGCDTISSASFVTCRPAKLDCTSSRKQENGR